MVWSCRAALGTKQPFFFFFCLETAFCFVVARVLSVWYVACVATRTRRDVQDAQSPRKRRKELVH